LKKLKSVCALIVVVSLLVIPVSFIFAGDAPSAIYGSYCDRYFNCDWTLSCVGDAIRCEMEMTNSYGTAYD